jgi:hypothetical protein
MSEEVARIHQPATEISEEALKRAEEMIEQEEGVQNKFTGAMAAFITLTAVVMSLFHLYASYEIVRTEVLRATHVAFVLFLSFLIFPVARRFRHRVMPWDWALALLGVAVCAWLISQGDDFFDRSITPTDWDTFFGVALIVLVLEAMRRATGWIMPVITICFLLYAFFGPYLPAPWTHKGYEIPRLIGHMYMTLEGIFGVAVDVSSSLIILFTSIPAPASSISTFRSPRWAASPPARDVPWCSPPSCSAAHRAPASPRPSRLARSPIQCSPRWATARTRRVACSQPGVSARSFRRRCWAPRRS